MIAPTTVTTNKDQAALSKAGKFRQDLCCRMAVTELQVPALASRIPEEIDEMIGYSLNHRNQSQIAEAIGWAINTLRNKIEKCGIDVEQYK